MKKWWSYWYWYWLWYRCCNRYGDVFWCDYVDVIILMSILMSIFWLFWWWCCFDYFDAIKWCDYSDEYFDEYRCFIIIIMMMLMMWCDCDWDCVWDCGWDCVIFNTPFERNALLDSFERAKSAFLQSFDTYPVWCCSAWRNKI